MLPSQSPTSRVIASELRDGLNGLLGIAVAIEESIRADGAVLVGTPSSRRLPRSAGPSVARLGDEGYLIRSTRVGAHAVTVIASKSEIGALYGAFHLLRLIQTGEPLAALDIAERPRLERRLLNHWDNLDGSIERGYAGRSLWNWAELPGDGATPRVRRLRARERVDRDQRHGHQQRQRQSADR